VRTVPYFVGVLVSLLAGLSIGWISGSAGIGVVASVVIFLVAAHVVRGRGGDDRVAERNAAAYPPAGRVGGHFDGSGGGFDGGGGGCDGGGGF
jgi:hypothetical protein